MQELENIYKENLTKLNFDNGLIPTIVQDCKNNEVLMMAYMNEESLRRTIETGTTWFWSRSRNEFWNKGATSGHYQYVKAIYVDCDEDTLLIKVDQIGAACHTGSRTCFYRNISI
jgi:phosphoribosyl-AMP cyclohydrolase